MTTKITHLNYAILQYLYYLINIAFWKMGKCKHIGYTPLCKVGRVGRKGGQPHCSLFPVFHMSPSYITVTTLPCNLSYGREKFHIFYFLINIEVPDRFPPSSCHAKHLVTQTGRILTMSDGNIGQCQCHFFSMLGK